MCRITERTTEALIAQINNMNYNSFSDAHFMILLLIMMKLKNFETSELLMTLVQQYAIVREPASCLFLRCVGVRSPSPLDSLHHPFCERVRSEDSDRGAGEGDCHRDEPGEDTVFCAREGAEESLHQVPSHGNDPGSHGVPRPGRSRAYRIAEVFLVVDGVSEVFPLSHL